MKLSIIRVLLILLFAQSISACDRIEKQVFGAPEDTYLGCLRSSLNGSHNFSAEEVRALCEEISDSTEPSYKWTEGGIIPSNDFTKCYDVEKKKLEKQGVSEPGDISKLLCKYARK